ncbi:MAG: DUF3810 domain-containing protein [Clostridia bacterium]|nr:DUF3810 domain-containing protein [Clostridia bacterium]
MKETTLSKQLLRLLWLLVLPVTFLLIKLAAKSPLLVDSIYSRSIYPVIRNGVSAVTRLFPFSAAEYLLYITAALLAIFLIIAVVRVIFIRKGALIKLLSLVISYAIFASYMLFLFYLMWGFNYYRPALAERLDLPDRSYNVEELKEVCFDLAEHAKALREGLPEDERGVFTWNIDEIKTGVCSAYAGFGASRPSFKADVPKVKAIDASKYLSKCGISGIYIPFTEEPSINVNEPFLYLAHSAAHETAHYMGYAREEDANFLAFLVGIGSTDPGVAYSGYMHALLNCGNALAAADPDAYRQLCSTYSEGMKNDLRDYSDHYNQYADTDTWKKSDEINDKYLKANNQQKGVLSYQEDVALVLRYYDSCRFFEKTR